MPSSCSGRRCLPRRCLAGMTTTGKVAFTMSGDDHLSAETPAAAWKPTLSAGGRRLVLATAFLGWFFAGVLMSTTSLAMRSAALDLLGRVGALDLPHFQALNEALRKHPGRPAPEEV